MRLLKTTAPSEVDAAGLAPADALLLARVSTARGVLFHGPSKTAGRPLGPARRMSRRGLRRAIAGLLAPSAPPPLPPSEAGAGLDAAPVVAFVAASEDGRTIAPLLRAISADLWRSVVPVTLAELPRWETRRVRGAASRAEAFLRELGRRLRGTPGLAESYAYRGVHFADLAGGDLEALLFWHLPEAVGRLEAAIELLGAARAGAALITVPGRDERRALVHACAAVGVGAVAVRLSPPSPLDAARADGGPQPLAALDWRPGDDPAPVVARLREATHGRVGSG